MAMRPAVTYTLYAASSKEKTGDVITFANFEEGNLLTETRNDSESGDESDSESLIMNEQDMENLDSNEQSETHPNVNKREARYEIRDRIRRKELQWKGALKATRNMGKGLHKVFSTIVKEILQELETLGESGSEVSHFIPEPRNFAEVKNWQKILGNLG